MQNVISNISNCMFILYSIIYLLIGVAMLHGKPEDLVKIAERSKQRRIEAQRIISQAWSQVNADGTPVSFQEKVETHIYKDAYFFLQVPS